jgi:hypothetical protein
MDSEPNYKIKAKVAKVDHVCRTILRENFFSGRGFVSLDEKNTVVFKFFE